MLNTKKNGFECAFLKFNSSRYSMALHLSAEVRERSAATAAAARRASLDRKSMSGGNSSGDKSSSKLTSGVSVRGGKFLLNDAFALSGDIDLEAGEAAGATAGGGVTLQDLKSLSSTYPGVEGNGLDVARSVCIAAVPGQVVLTTAAWSHMQGRAPAGAYPLSLGLHMVGGGCKL